MPNLMRDYISLRKVPGRFEAIAEFLKETHVQIDFVVLRAIKRTRRGLGKAACRLDFTSEKNELGFLIPTPHATKDSRPGVLGVPENCGNKIFCGFVRGRR